VSDKTQRQAARAVVADYHHAQLDELVARVVEITATLIREQPPSTR
jgi:hypothetical protein